MKSVLQCAERIHHAYVIIVSCKTNRCESKQSLVFFYLQRCIEESQKSKVAVISKAISNVCLYANLDIRCRLDYEVGIAHFILHQYPQAHLYSGAAYLCAEHSKFSETRGVVWHPGARHGRLFRNNFVRPSPLFRENPKSEAG
ncbi:unnamed protein product [Lasius platythorax]|uniref:Uncharacterized protein n=1 Tax=Lasius platythorax TaxID=488582 RepID=A0AAV2P293_9HYME